MGQGLVMEHLDSFSMDNKGNVVREFICNIPIPNIKITKVLYYSRICNFSEWLRKVIPCL